jgi:hypothetical protein
MMVDIEKLRVWISIADAHAKSADCRQTVRAKACGGVRKRAAKGLLRRRQCCWASVCVELSHGQLAVACSLVSLLCG